MVRRREKTPCELFRVRPALTMIGHDAIRNGRKLPSAMPQQLATRSQRNNLAIVRAAGYGS